MKEALVESMEMKLKYMANFNEWIHVSNFNECNANTFCVHCRFGFMVFCYFGYLNFVMDI